MLRLPHLEVGVGVEVEVGPRRNAGEPVPLPTELLAVGIVFRTLVQRVVAALGLALLTAMVSARQSQHMADRSALLQSGAVDRPASLARMADQGRSHLLAWWQAATIRSAADAYSDVFLLLGIVTLASIPLVFIARWGEPPETEREAVRVGA